MTERVITNRVAVSLALDDTTACLAALSQLSARVSLAELRLDLMHSFDLPRLIAESPCQLIITCRAAREGGAFQGSEAERHAILRAAMRLNGAYVDVEWDDLEKLQDQRQSNTRLIASRHWHDRMPTSLWPFYESLRGRADVVKLVGLARTTTDTLPVLELLSRATSPVIGLAMGAAGRLTRLLAPTARHCLLTYGARSRAELTAPGQLTIAEMLDVYHLDRVGPHTPIHLHLCTAAAEVDAFLRQDMAAAGGDLLRLPLLVSTEEAADLLKSLPKYLPRVSFSAAAQLKQLLPEAARA